MWHDVILCWFITLSEHYRKVKGAKSFSEAEFSPLLRAAQSKRKQPTCHHCGSAEQPLR